MNAEAPRPVRDLDEAFAACLDDLDAGLTLAQALARYPDYAEALAPLLVTSARLRGASWPALSMGARVRGRGRMHAELERRRRGAGMTWWRSAWNQFGVALALVVLAAGAWLAWPGREVRTITQPTATPTVITLPENATPRPTSSVTATASSTGLPDESGTRAPITPEPRTTESDPALTAPAATATPAPGAGTSTPPARPTGAASPGDPAGTPTPGQTDTARPATPSRTPEAAATSGPASTSTPPPTGTKTRERTQTPEPAETAKPDATEMSRPNRTPAPPAQTHTPKPSETEASRSTKTAGTA